MMNESDTYILYIPYNTERAKEGKKEGIIEEGNIFQTDVMIPPMKQFR